MPDWWFTSRIDELTGRLLKAQAELQLANAKIERLQRAKARQNDALNQGWSALMLLPVHIERNQTFVQACQQVGRELQLAQGERDAQRRLAQLQRLRAETAEAEVARLKALDDDGPLRRRRHLPMP